PVATAFWRAFLALPLLWLWAVLQRAPSPAADTHSPFHLLVLAGLFFAGDLAVWHWSIVLTSVANATLLANLAPIFVTLAAWALYRLAPTWLFTFGMAIALAGMALLIRGDFTLGTREVLGDVLGIVTAMFYAGYQLTVSRLRSSISTARVMAWSSTITSVVLLPIALVSESTLLPTTPGGWIFVAGLALIAQVAGQSLIAYAMAHLSALFSSVGLLLQPVVAAVLAWLLLGEPLGIVQLAGGALVLLGIALANKAERGRSPVRATLREAASGTRR
ncbi:MAG TPA: DMT family transporter, partial [Burkholderiales bacterium]|nr:DMT family transporter [Burkholderiales bacterium]